MNTLFEKTVPPNILRDSIKITEYFIFLGLVTFYHELWRIYVVFINCVLLTTIW